jgi:hypothetical protein
LDRLSRDAQPWDPGHGGGGRAALLSKLSCSLFKPPENSPFLPEQPTDLHFLAKTLRIVTCTDSVAPRRSANGFMRATMKAELGSLPTSSSENPMNREHMINLRDLLQQSLDLSRYLASTCYYRRPVRQLR